MEDIDIAKQEIPALLSTNGKKSKDPTGQLIRQYKEALDYIYFEWLASPEPVNLETIVTLYGIISNERIRISTYDFERGLQYAQIKPEHPLVQAAIMHMVIHSFQPFEKHTELLSQLLFNLVLYKYGHDSRGYVVMEEYFCQQRTEYKEVITLALKQNNVTAWLEFVINGYHQQMEHTVQYVRSLIKQGANVNDSFFVLTDRQKGIMATLDEPGSRITNQKVQKLFHISQITASRELAKLAELGLLFPVGRGRSTAYTKA